MSLDNLVFIKARKGLFLVNFDLLGLNFWLNMNRNLEILWSSSYWNFTTGDFLGLEKVGNFASFCQ